MSLTYAPFMPTTKHETHACTKVLSNTAPCLYQKTENVAWNIYFFSLLAYQHTKAKIKLKHAQWAHLFITSMVVIIFFLFFLRSFFVWIFICFSFTLDKKPDIWDNTQQQLVMLMWLKQHSSGLLYRINFATPKLHSSS